MMDLTHVDGALQNGKRLLKGVEDITGIRGVARSFEKA